MSKEMISLETAQAIVLDHVLPTPSVRIASWQAAGRPLAEDVVTDIDLAPYANSAMDGYAVKAADLVDADEDAPVVLDVIGHEAAGEVFEGGLEAGQTIRIMTGAPLPDGADAVVKYEIVEVLEGDGNEGSRVAFRHAVPVGNDVRRAGLEARAGDVVMRAGEVPSAAGVGLLASAGAAEVAVHARPVVGVISIGSEIVDPACVPRRGQIRDANASVLLAAAREAGAEPRSFGIVADDPAAIRELVMRAVAECDMVVTSGGASSGDYDYVTALVAQEGEVLFDYISLRPGKAITFGMVRDVPFLGLSGNPAAAAVGFEMLARPAIRRMLGFSAGSRPVQLARIGHDVPKKQERRYYNRARLVRDGETGELVVMEAKSQDSSLLGTLQHANCLVMVPEGRQGYAAGDAVPCVRIDIDEGTVL